MRYRRPADLDDALRLQQLLPIALRQVSVYSLNEPHTLVAVVADMFVCRLREVGLPSRSVG